MVRTSDGVEIAYEVHGRPDDDVPSVVLVHGWAGNRTCWEHQVRFLSERRQVIALDLGGHGGSGLGRVDWTLRAFGGDVVAVVEEVDAPKVALVGHSMGGDAAVFAAQQLGDRVGGIVWVDVVRSLGDEPVSPPEVVDGFLGPFEADFRGAVDQFARNIFPPGADGALVDRIAADMASVRQEATLGSLQYALNRHPPLIAALSEISAPVVAINPDIAPTDIDSMQRHGVETTIVEGVGHLLMLEAPERCNEALASALASFDS